MVKADINVALIYKNETTKANFGKIFSANKMGFIPLPAKLNGDTANQIKEKKANVVIVEQDDSSSEEMVFVESIISGIGEIPVYVVNPSADVDTVRKLMRSGVMDIFSVPVNEKEVIEEISQSGLSLEKNSEVTGYVVSVLNGKSGSGSTTVAINLACDIAESNDDMKVALVDLDIQFGSISLYLNKKWKSTVMDALVQAARLDSLMLKAMMNSHDSGAFVLPAPNKIVLMDHVTAEAVKKFINVAKSCFDIVILDMPRSINAWSEQALKDSDEIFMVVQRNLAVIRDSRLLINYFGASDISKEKVTLINNRNKSKHSTVKDKQIEETLEIERIFHIANDYDVALSAQDHGAPLCSYAKHSRLHKDIASISRALVERVTGEKPEPSGFFERIIRR